MTHYHRPATLEDALALRAAAPVTVLAGGTDIYPARTTRAAWAGANDPAIVDISAVTALRGIRDCGTHWSFGALTTWSDVICAALPPAFAGLKLAAAEVGGRQIQNKGTLGGNICNASPAADSVPVLLTLDATVQLASMTGTRDVALSDFITGNRATACRPDEIVTAINVPSLPLGATSHFLKLGARHSLVISIAMCSIVLVVGPDNRVTDARLAVGACSSVARRIHAMESALISQPADKSLLDRLCPRQLAQLRPIDDVRASAAYRLDAAFNLVRETLLQLLTDERRRIT